MNVSLKLLQKISDVIQPSKTALPLIVSSILLNPHWEKFCILDETRIALHYCCWCCCINDNNINDIWIKHKIANFIQFQSWAAQHLQEPLSSNGSSYDCIRGCIRLQDETAASVVFSFCCSLTEPAASLEISFMWSEIFVVDEMSHNHQIFPGFPPSKVLF